MSINILNVLELSPPFDAEAPPPRPTGPNFGVWKKPKRKKREEEEETPPWLLKRRQYTEDVFLMLLLKGLL